jgi:hypothetical protein
MPRRCPAGMLRPLANGSGRGIVSRRLTLPFIVHPNRALRSARSRNSSTCFPVTFLNFSREIPESRGIVAAFAFRMPPRPFLSIVTVLGILAASPAISQASPQIVVSIPDQKLAIVENGLRVAQFPVSTSKFGVGDRLRSFATPLGTLQIADKVGYGARPGAVFKGRRATGEVLRPNAPGRDPIVTRILHLRGLEAKNSQAYDRGIYIHGTPEERRIGHPASYGCIRMRSRDVMRVFDAVPVGTKVEIVNTTLGRAMQEVATNHTGNDAG